MRYALIALLLVASTAMAHDEPTTETSIDNPRSGGTSALRLLNLNIAPDGVVHGTLTSQSADPIRDITLLVHHTWHWKNEQQPGEDSPGRSTFFQVPDEVPALGTREFTYVPSPPLPEREDGSFKTTVEISRYTEVGQRVETRTLQR